MSFNIFIPVFSESLKSDLENYIWNLNRLNNIIYHDDGVLATRIRLCDKMPEWRNG